ncbi:MAG: hypothetical protein BGO98_47425 [Myxococcales bacterium 68-20]|nr:hypothetical protein [Myxococcales bacterium]OJY29492.1 MAG: hypothetical protein BGO98_47425 [Myxococcales bacterium 68-20]
MSSSPVRVSKEGDLLPKKTSSTAKPSAGKSSSGSSGASSTMRRVMRIVRLIGVLLGGLVTLVAMMSLVGLVTDSFWARLIIALVVVVGFPAFVADRLLKRTSLGGGLAMVGDVFAIVLLVVANVLVAVDFASKPLFVREGDRYARSGSRTMARVAYFLGGVSPVFPDEKGTAPAASATASASASASGAASASGDDAAAPATSGDR